MKKIKFLLVAVVAVLFVTGCGNNLTCTKTEEESGIKVSQTISMDFNGNKVNYVKMTVDSVAIDETIKDNWDIFVNILDGQFEPKNEKGIKLSTNNDKNKYTYSVSYEVDLNKADKDALEEIGLENLLTSTDSREDVKKDAEADGYTCK